MTFSENKQVKLSIVIAAWNGISALRECLSSLEKQIETTDTEVIVVSNFESEISEIETRFPLVRHIILSEKAIVPELRTRGILEARGVVIALLEDLCTFDSNWRQEIEKAYELPFGIIGGAIENSSVERALNWAVYFYDYGKYMPPNQAGVTDALSGMNVSYKREILEQIQESYKDGFFETFINEELKRRGHELYLMPSAIIYHRKNYDLKKTVNQFYHQARSFAARRVSDAPFSKRLSFILASLILPILLPVRVTSRTISKRRHFKELIISLPFLTFLMTVWAFGEFCGYLNGEGASGCQWR
ncbi:hypothetical protein BH18ACI1_BH18ACI1_13510 [soil metagenome]